VERLELAAACDGEEKSVAPYASLVEAKKSLVLGTGLQLINDFGAYSFTSTFMNEHSSSASSTNPNDKVFRYRIPLQVAAPVKLRPGSSAFTAISVMLGFNILTTHFSLYLKDSHDRVIVRGIETASPAANRDHLGNDKSGLPGGDENFAVALEASLLPGSYSLDIEQDRSDVDSIGQLSKISLARKELHHCTNFVFGLQAKSIFDSATARDTCYLESIEPRGGLKLDPTVDLTITAKFSCPVMVAPLMASDHTHVPQLSNTMWLRPIGKWSERIVPGIVRFQNHDLTRIVAVFDHKHFATHRVRTARYSSFRVCCMRSYVTCCDSAKSGRGTGISHT
jgi:hypothetical protein